MKLSEFIEELAYGELSDLSMNAGDGVLKDDAQPKIVIRLNDVLNQLYTKYIIRIEDSLVDTTLKAYSYTLTNPNSVRIIYAEPDTVDEYEICKRNDLFSVEGNTLTFRRHPIGNLFRIKYQWRPSKLGINPAKSSFDNQELDLDAVLVPLVRTLVASGIFTNMNGELHKKTGIELFNQGQFILNELEVSGILRTSVGFYHNRFKANGFA